jgi:integrase/recombinase XerD
MVNKFSPAANSRKSRPTTSTGIRDRAVLLLLIRLGLRAGDVAALKRSDLSFETGTIKVSGKGHREVRLPLPQDVGEALLEYLRVGRPKIESEYVFLRCYSISATALIIPSR